MTYLKRGAPCAFLASATTLLVAAPQAQAIVNGEKATESYPFMGSLQNPTSPRPDGPACGATLVEEEWVVTARHCVDGRGEPDTMKVRMGSSRVDRGGELIGWPPVSGYPSGRAVGPEQLLRPGAMPTTRMCSPTAQSSAARL
ncbi:trypsin-like serine protease [Streptomyces sp. NPDC093707]|uniref:trypsin-like serine protease n=1 Tax=Streptomyces sp. NPDC093707 TaxID=3154984 RepID=UPI00344E07D0